MNCDQIDECLIDFVEGALSEADAGPVRTHIASCPNCRAAAKDTRELMGIMDAVKERQERVWATTSARGGGGGVRLPARDAFTHLGDFEIVGEMGRGGMGVVYRARQVSLNRVVALKVMPEGMLGSGSAVARFQKEARAAAKLHHTNIVPVYSQGVQDGRYYYAMELIHGVSLGELIREEDPPAGPSADAWREIRGDMRNVARLIANVADALDHAHRSGVLHRDIKPQNLLLGSDRELHITDFGLANVLDEPSVTQTGEMVGTPAYMSPEQVAADPHAIDRRTDIYSLGVTLYEVLTGRRPFEGSTREQLVARIRMTDPVSPCKVDPSTPIDLDTICMRALEKEPSRRYQTAGEMAADLRRFAEDRPILSRRVSWFEKGVKWVRRHKAFTTIVALAVTMASGISVWTYQAAAARHREADRLVEEAFKSLAYDSYRETAEPAGKLQRAERLGPNNRARFLEVSALCNLLSDHRSAIESLQAAAELRPADTEIQYLLAWAFWRDNKKDAATACIAKADASGGPQTAAAHFFRAQSLLRHQPDDAIKSLRNAIRAQGDYAQALLHLARANNHWTYHHRSNERFFDTENNLKFACELQPGRAYPQYLLSLAYRMSGEIWRAEGREDQGKARFDAALVCAKEAQKQSDSPLGFAAEAEYWESLGQYEEALAARSKCEPLCRATNEIVELCQYRWRLYYWLGRYAEASADLDRLARHVPETDPLHPLYIHVFPALMEAEGGDLNAARRRVLQMADRPTPRRLIATVSFLRLLGGQAEAEALLQREHSGLDWSLEPIEGAPVDWWKRVHGVAGGSVSVAETIQSLPADSDSTLLAPLHFVEACRLHGMGDRSGAAEAWRACEATFDYQDFEYVARVILGRVQADPEWPNWIVRTPAGVP